MTRKPTADDVFGDPLPPEPEPDEPVSLDAERARRRGTADASPPSQATQLVDMAMARFRIVKDESGLVYAEDHHRPGIAVPLRGNGGVRQELSSAFYAATGRAATGAALADAVTVLEGEGMRCDPVPVFLRSGQLPRGTRLLDLGTEYGSTVALDADGWRIADTPPALFRRSALTAPMPAPVDGGSLDLLRSLINCDEEGFRLIVGWMLVALCEDVQSPILALTGQQGSAKSTALRMIIALVDASVAPLKSPPRNEDAWASAAHASAVVGVDNFSSCPPWFSDTLARTVSGDAVIKRAHYTDNDVAVVRYRRAVALSSISPEGLQADVADRMCTVELTPITAGNRRMERDLWAEFEAARPSILGALLDLLVLVEIELPNTRPENLPRLADAGLRFAALDRVTGWEVLTTFKASQASAAVNVVDADVFAGALAKFARERGTFTGTATELLAQLTPDSPPRSWPRTPRATSSKLLRLAPAMKSAGVLVEQLERTKHGRPWRISELVADADPARTCAVCAEPLSELLPESTTVHPTCDPEDTE